MLCAPWAGASRCTGKHTDTRCHLWWCPTHTHTHTHIYIYARKRSWNIRPGRSFLHSSWRVNGANILFISRFKMPPLKNPFSSMSGARAGKQLNATVHELGSVLDSYRAKKKTARRVYCGNGCVQRRHIFALTKTDRRQEDSDVSAGLRWSNISHSGIHSTRMEIMFCHLASQQLRSGVGNRG